MDRKGWTGKLREKLTGKVSQPKVSKKANSMLDRVKSKVLAEQKESAQALVEYEEFMRLAASLGSIGQAKRFRGRLLRLSVKRRRTTLRRAAMAEAGLLREDPAPRRLRARVRLRRWDGTLKTPKRLRTEKRKRLRLLVREARRQNR